MQIWPSAGTLPHCSFVIIITSVCQTAESKFVHLNIPAESNGATYVGKQYFMSSVITEKSVEVLPLALIKLLYLLTARMS